MYASYAHEKFHPLSVLASGVPEGDLRAWRRLRSGLKPRPGRTLKRVRPSKTVLAIVCGSTSSQRTMYEGTMPCTIPLPLSPCFARLANLSALSFPSSPLWPFTHPTLRMMPLLSKCFAHLNTDDARSLAASELQDKRPSTDQWKICKLVWQSVNSWISLRIGRSASHMSARTERNET